MNTGPTSSVDRHVLLLIKRKTEGDLWTNLNGWHANNTDLNSWLGVTASTDGRVVKLELRHAEDRRVGTRIWPFCKLAFSLDEAAFRTDKQKVLLYEQNALVFETIDETGSIPAEVGKLENLERLVLVYYNFTGIIPVELGKLGRLKILSLVTNQLTGIIPPELGQLKSLELLNLMRNKLTGSIPATLGQLVRLKYLDLSDNQLTGSIPVELGRLGSLGCLNLAKNQLTGSIPVELRQLGALKTLYLWENQLTGFGGVEDALILTSKFVSMSEVYLQENPWRMPPEAVVEQGLTAVQTYLNAIKTARDPDALTISLQLLKVVLMGSSRAGKTSLINSIAEERAAPTQGSLEEASTVGIELHTRTLGDTTVEFYDCAGQLDYAGMHQTFLSKRALYLLVWDVTEFQERCTYNFDRAIQEKIMEWLILLQLRAPNASVILVANKCDASLEEYKEIADRVEKRAQELFEEWLERRGFDGRISKNPIKLSWQANPSLVSCQAYLGISELVQRISDFGSTSIELPPSWNLALDVLNALRKGRSPRVVASEHFRLRATPLDTAREGNWTHTSVTREEISTEWQSIISWVKSELKDREETQGLSITGIEQAMLSSPDSAFEGALWISEYAGNIIRFDGGEGLFLDVVWLSKVLSPILSHKLSQEFFESNKLSKSRDYLVNNGILRVNFARYLWRKVLDGSTMEERDRLIKGLYSVLLKLGVILPLDRRSLLGIDGHMERSPPDVLVMMRLADTDYKIDKGKLERCLKEAPEGYQEVVMKWRFDSAGAPYGFVERLIASCDLLGEVEMKLCWRFGAVFKSRATLRRNGQPIRLYRFIIRCDDVDVPGQRLLSLRMAGPLEDPRVWEALRFVASHMVIQSEEWRGVWWEGWSECLIHPDEHLYLAAPRQANVGDRLIPDARRGSEGCDCLLNTGTVQAQVLTCLGEVIDTRKVEPLETLLEAGEPIPPTEWRTTPTGDGEAIQPADRATIPTTDGEATPPTDGGASLPTDVGATLTTDERAILRADGATSSYSRTPTGDVSVGWRWCRVSFVIWRRNVLYFAPGLGGLALTLFCSITLVGLVEEIDYLWIGSLPFVVVLALAALVSAAFACGDAYEHERSAGSRIVGGLSRESSGPTRSTPFQIV